MISTNSNKYSYRILIVGILLMTSLSSMAQMKWNQAYQSYIDRYKDLAIEQMQKHRVPASITLAQGLLESGAGKSKLATYGNNHFGIKCHDWTGRSMRQNDDAPQECFRVYDDVRDSYEDHSLFLHRKRYESLFSLNPRDYKGWAHGLKSCGYATNPRYAQQLIGIIELYKLYSYDTSRGYDKFIFQHTGHNNSYQIFAYNKNYYVKAKKGDTFSKIGKELNVSPRKLASYNERDKNDVLSQGDIVYLKKKRSKADKAFKGRYHRIKSGESMYAISQFYGIRLKSLYKKNHLTPDYDPHVGDELRVY